MTKPTNSTGLASSMNDFIAELQQRKLVAGPGVKQPQTLITPQPLPSALPDAPEAPAPGMDAAELQLLIMSEAAKLSVAVLEPLLQRAAALDKVQQVLSNQVALLAKEIQESLAVARSYIAEEGV